MVLIPKKTPAMMGKVNEEVHRISKSMVIQWYVLQEASGLVVLLLHGFWFFFSNAQSYDAMKSNWMPDSFSMSLGASSSSLLAPGLADSLTD